MRALGPITIIVSVALICPMARAQDKTSRKAAQARNAWLYKADGKDGFFQKGGGKRWIETTPEGVEFRFEEVQRTDAYVEMFDRNRSISVRLSADHAEWRRGQDSPWNRIHAGGRWVAARELPAATPHDYRIRLAYFVPSDRKPAADYEKRFRVVMQIVSELYRQDYEARKVRTAGLRFETREDQPVVHLIRGSRTAAFYNNAPNYNGDHQWKQIQAEIPRSVGIVSKNVIIVLAETYDFGPAKIEWAGSAGIGQRFSTDGGLALMSAWILRPEFCATTLERQKKLILDTTPIVGRVALSHGQPNSPRFKFIEDGFGAVAHELGHALGLPHDHRRNDIYMMGAGFRNMHWNFMAKPDPQRRVRFSDDNARILYSSRYLAADALLSDRLPPEVELRWAGALKVGANQVKVSVTTSDNEGLRALLFYAPAGDSVVGGRALQGKQQTFEETVTVPPLQPGSFRLEAFVTDAGGNLTRAEITGATMP